MNVKFIASVAIITPDLHASLKLYLIALALPLKSQQGEDYYHSEKIAGTKHFGVWPLTQAAQACFGRPEWPTEYPLPQASIEFEVADAEAVASAAKELQDQGYPLLHEARLEPWGQTVARLLSPEGLIIGISFAPSLHESVERKAT
jgi:catechol 2,3-dioxygenase-like lactoylglutathione lyase family enzyme